MPDMNSTTTERAEHTPGPWRVDDDQAIVATIDHIERVIGFTSPFSEGGMGERERHANARLIAAAPELLAACEALSAFQRYYQQNAYDTFPGNPFYAAKAMAVVDAARAAIAKAEGGAK